MQRSGELSLLCLTAYMRICHQKSHVSCCTLLLNWERRNANSHGALLRVNYRSLAHWKVIATPVKALGVSVGFCRENKVVSLTLFLEEQNLRELVECQGWDLGNGLVKSHVELNGGA